MKKMIVASLALLLAFAVIPAMAGEKPINNQDPAAFHALSKLSVPGQTVLNKMTDDQLAKIEGRKTLNLNISSIRQRNIAVFACLAICGAIQSNSATVTQVNSN
jgi:hypothetical protein